MPTHKVITIVKGMENIIILAFLGAKVCGPSGGVIFFSFIKKEREIIIRGMMKLWAPCFVVLNSHKTHMVPGIGHDRKFVT